MTQSRDHTGIGAVNALGRLLAALAVVVLVAITPVMAVADAAAPAANDHVVAMDHGGAPHVSEAPADAGASTCCDGGACVGLVTGITQRVIVATATGPISRGSGIPITQPDSPFRPPVISR